MAYRPTGRVVNSLSDPHLPLWSSAASASKITELEPRDDALLSTCIYEYRYQVKGLNILRVFSCATEVLYKNRKLKDKSVITTYQPSYVQMFD